MVKYNVKEGTDMTSFSGFKYRDNNRSLGMWKNYGGKLYVENDKIVIFGGLFSKKIAEFTKGRTYIMHIENEGIAPLMRTIRIQSSEYSFDLMLNKSGVEQLVKVMREKGYIAV